MVFFALLYIIHAETSGLRQGISDPNHDVAAIKDRVDKDEESHTVGIITLCGIGKDLVTGSMQSQNWGGGDHSFGVFAGGGRSWGEGGWRR